jgi:hypothetical protein
MADELPDELKQSLSPLIETIAYLNEKIAAYDKEIEAVANASIQRQRSSAWFTESVR